MLRGSLVKMKMILLIMIVLFGMIILSSPIKAEGDLEACWTGENVSTDLTSNGNDLTNTGGDSYRLGKIGFAFDSTTANHWSIPHASITGNFSSAQYTICLWHNADSLPQNGGLYSYGIVTGDNDRKLQTSYGANSKVESFIQGGGNTQANANQNAGTWYHNCVVGNGTHRILYMDSVAQTDIDPFSDIDEGYGDFNLGVYTEFGTYGFNGIIDEVSIWKRALSASEISDLFTEETTCAESIAGEGIVILNITSVNCTSSNPVSNQVMIPGGNICLTNVTVPKMDLRTNTASDCRVHGNVSNSVDVVTAFLIGLPCQVTGSLAHSCRIHDSNVFNNLTSASMYIGCNDTINNIFNSTGAMQINLTGLTQNGGGGTELISCISVIGEGCGVSFANNCAVITT